MQLAPLGLVALFNILATVTFQRHTNLMETGNPRRGCVHGRHGILHWAGLLEVYLVF